MPSLTPEQALQIGLEYQKSGRLGEAEFVYRQIIAQQPGNAMVLHLLGVIAHLVRKQDVAADLIGRAIAINPNAAEFHNTLGLVHMATGRLESALETFHKAIQIRPDFAEAHENLGSALLQKREFAQAIASYRIALQFQPNCAQTHCNLGSALLEAGKLDEALAAYRTSIQLGPELADAHNCLGNAFKAMARLDEAIDCYRQATTIRPNDPAFSDNLVNLITFLPACNAQMVRWMLVGWNNRHAAPLQKLIQPHSNDRNPTRKLRIGYISPDFRAHCQAMFTVPLLSHHDPSSMDVYCYSDVLSPDHRTQQIRDLAAHWVTIGGQTDQQVADQIRNDQIDILIDLTMHMAGNRLLVLARKPAPVQISYLAYPGSTGVEAIDYRISDPYLDPPGTDLSIYSEQTLLLPRSFWCYDPLEKAEDFPVSPLPALEKGYLTFGCLNNFCKVNDGVLELWARVLKQVSNSRLLLLAPAGSARERVLEKLKQEGIEPSRIEFTDFVPRQQYLKTYHRIDLALETLPAHGHTTSLDALWMGVLTPTLIGKTLVGRAGMTILSNVGLTDLIAESPEQYVQKIVGLASDIPWLNELRQSLRKGMIASPLMDAAAFAKNMEQLFRSAWERWCRRL